MSDNNEYESGDNKHELVELQVRIWEKAVDTQMHFNQMSVKSRQLGISLIVVIIGFAIALVTRTNPDYFPIKLPWFSIHISVLITIVPPVIMQTIKYLDTQLYHKMLRGAVTFGENLENCHLTKNVMKTHQGMTQMISLYSRYEGVVPCDPCKSDEGNGILGPKYVGSNKSNASDKLNTFYCRATILLCFIPLVLLLVQPI